MNIAKKKSIAIFLTIFLWSCSSSLDNSSNSNTSNNQTANIRERADEAKNISPVWVPGVIDDCLKKVNVGEPFDFETTINPFYLRADLDGNEMVDYVVLVKGKNTKKRGVIICKDSRNEFVFGEISRRKRNLTSFKDDNFVTAQWEISTKAYTQTQADPHGRKINPRAKGEAVSFLFEGGEGVNIYWDGTEFMIGE